MHTFTLVAGMTLVQLAQVVSPESLVNDVRKLAVAQDNDDRFDALTQMLRARNLTFSVEPFTREKAVGSEPRTRGRNIVLTLGEGAEEILVGAHYDAIRLSDGSLGPGAVDNGASSVMLVRLAEMLSKERLAKRVKIVWFDMEEYGLIGSARYVEAHASDRIVAMLNCDIDGYGDTVVFGPPQGGDDVRLRTVFGQTCVDEAHQLWLLLHAGAVSGLAQGTAPAIMRTIHTADDTVSKVDGVSMARELHLMVALVRRLTAE
jgi:acetylornithine deacetylase/succinyl-diaminopimelate desuccinylase-like protein